MDNQEIDDILNSVKPSPNEVVDEIATEDIKPVENSVSGAKLEVAGVIIDDFGNSWQVPGDNVTDLDDLYGGSIYKMPEKLTKEFHVQLIPLTRLREYAARKFVPVRLEELNIPVELGSTTGQPLDTYHVVGDSILVKCPRVIFERLQARKIKEVKDRLRQLEPTDEMVSRSQNSGVVVRTERRQSVDFYKDTKLRPGIGLEGEK